MLGANIVIGVRDVPSWVAIGKSVKDRFACEANNRVSPGLAKRGGLREVAILPISEANSRIARVDDHYGREGISSMPTKCRE